MKLAVVGSRVWKDQALVGKVLNYLHKQHTIECVVSGGAKGADTFGEEWALGKEIPTEVFLPDWKQFGRSAGYRRNVQIVAACTHLIGFWDGKSRGTKHSLDLASEAGKPTAYCLPDGTLHKW